MTFSSFFYSGWLEDLTVIGKKADKSRGDEKEYRGLFNELAMSTGTAD